MARSKLLALTLATAIMFTPAPVRAGIVMPLVIPQGGSSSAVAFGLGGCFAGILLAVIDAGRRFNRELTAEEAATCGLLYWINVANRRP